MLPPPYSALTVGASNPNSPIFLHLTRMSIIQLPEISVEGFGGIMFKGLGFDFVLHEILHLECCLKELWKPFREA